MVSELARQANQGIVQLLGSRFQPKQRSNSPRGKEVKMPCPFCGGEDRFAVWEDNNTWSCRGCYGDGMPQQDVITFVQKDMGKSFIEACAYLGIGMDDSTGRKRLENSKKGYENLADYAKHKRVPVSVFTDVKWRDGEWQGRRAIIYPTYARDNGHVKVVERVRFIDGEKPTYKPCETGAPAVWYGLKTAIELAQRTDSPLFLCNGEASTLVAQYYQVPAFCKTGGETGNLPDELLSELQATWQGKIAIALDCDKQGREASVKLNQRITDSSVIDLGFADEGDLADFCKLYEQTSLQALLHRIPIKRPETVQDAITYVSDIANNRRVDEGRTLTMPYRLLHPLGGLCRYLPPGKLTLVFGMSGHGKTSFVEPMMEFWQQTGHNGIFDGREFDPSEYEFRRIQRHSGQVVESMDGAKHHFKPLSYTDFMAHKKAQEEERDNTPKFLRDGVFLTHDQQRTVAWVESFVNRWTGKVRYAPKKSYLDDMPGIDPAINSKQAADDKRYGTLTWARHFVNEQRDNGVPIDYMIFDYMQLFNLHTNNAPTNAYQTALYMIKDFAVEMRVHCIVLSQVNKNDDSATRSQNKPLGVSAMQFINDAPANLTISLNIAYADTTEVDWQGNAQTVKQQLPNGNFAGMLWVIKNSMEKTGQVKMQADLAHYRWIDASWQPMKADLLDDEG
jgi:hypothetical protein